MLLLSIYVGALMSNSAKQRDIDFSPPAETQRTEKKMVCVSDGWFCSAPKYIHGSVTMADLVVARRSAFPQHL